MDVLCLLILMLSFVPTKQANVINNYNMGPINKIYITMRYNHGAKVCVSIIN